MTSLQSTLGDEQGIADELAANQREISIAEFFEKNKHMLGFDSGARGLVTAVKEAVDNALDATEEAGILPDIYVGIEEVGNYYRLVVEDNGPGITKEQIPKVFGKLLYGSRFHAREQSRGQQGIGISAAVLYSQLTSGKPAKITSRTQGSAEAQYFELIIDTDTNEPEISTEKTTSWDRPHGTRIELEMEANMRARGQLRDYIKHTAVVNPHARIELHEPNDSFKSERATDQLPAETEEIRPHPHGVELGTVIKMLGATDSHSLSGFLQEEFTRVGKKTAGKVLDNFRDRHFGREMAWKPPEDLTVVERAVREATANKAADAVEAFASGIAKRVSERDRLAHHELAGIVAEVADGIAAEHGTFGATVREKAVEAAWIAIIEDRDAECYRLVDGATSTRKDEATVEALAGRIATKFDDDRNRLPRSTLTEYVDRAADMTQERDDVAVGETARENIVEEFWSVMRTVLDDVPLAREVANDRNTARELVEAMRETDIIAPPTDCLAPITAELVEAGLKKEFDAEFYAAATRDAEVHGGDPFIVEAGIAYGGEIPAEGSIDVMRFANRVPLVYQRGACATTDVVKSIGWRNYGLDQPGDSGLPNGPAVVMVHVASTNVPFTSESKDAIANVPAIEDEIELAIREAARELKSYLNKQRSIAKRRKKQDVLATILPEMAEKVAEVTERESPNIDAALARIMNNVQVSRAVKDGSVRLLVENHSGTSEDIELTDIVSAEPSDLSEGTVIEMDGEWFVKWSPTVPAGETATLEYRVDEDVTFDLDVSGVETAKLTVER
ncbi:DNA topoisomerase VI subunit B [Halalkalicoccus subterraneus]|uniref:DNA topoisomerase VI subunit B n=1 Tax=Halalkalicoccus subterraneus TaxID=2675002 RepID=UPI000EFB3E9A|nr:DNA topoisomerase VI subunit B [Halalkalicoccus subterraneus]